MTEKFLLNWTKFHDNISESYKELREESNFSDVTLACDGNQQFKVHKLIIAASSQIFKEMLISYNNSRPLIYLRGITPSDLNAIIDFIYFGEANVYQEDLDRFLALAEEFKVKGLFGKSQSESQSRTEEVTFIAEEQEKVETKIKQRKNTHIQSNSSRYQQRVQQFSSISYPEAEQINIIAKEQENFNVNSKHNDVTIGHSNNLINQRVVKQEKNTEMSKGGDTETKETSIQQTLSEMEELDQTINSMVKKRVSGWTCKVCGKVSVKKDNLKKHTEVHIEGIKRPCLTCGKTFKSRDSLSSHRAASHKAVQI